VAAILRRPTDSLLSARGRAIGGVSVWNGPALTSIPPEPGRRYGGGMEDAIEAFVSEWLKDNAAVLDEIVAMQGDDPTTPYGAAVAAAMATVRTWEP
jgi:hypothetical protein